MSQAVIKSQTGMNTIAASSIDTSTIFVEASHPSSVSSSRRLSQSECPTVLTDIYQDDVNLCVWQRSLARELLAAAEKLLNLDYAFQFSGSLAADDAYDVLLTRLSSAFSSSAEANLVAKDISDIVAMFCELFDLEQVGLRLSVLERAMCPKFHVDRVPARLVTTYSEIATEWLAHDDVNRAKLGVGSNGKADQDSGLYASERCINQLQCGDVGLLKGESWLGNEGYGLIHRSPSLSDGKKRLLLTLDFN